MTPSGSLAIARLPTPTTEPDNHVRHSADRIIGETNNGGDLVKEVLRTASGGKIFRFRAVTASRGKYARAEPIAALYEQGRVHHVGTFPDLEDQMCTWTPKGPADVSPDRMDALVWAISHLINRTNHQNMGLTPTPPTRLCQFVSYLGAVKEVARQGAL